MPNLIRWQGGPHTGDEWGTRGMEMATEKVYVLKVDVPYLLPTCIRLIFHVSS